LPLLKFQPSYISLEEDDFRMWIW